MMRTWTQETTGGGDVSPADTIFDARKEPGIGMVNYEPYAQQPFITESIRIMSHSKDKIPIETGGAEGK